MINPAYKPFISDEQILPEFTLRAVLLGALLGIVFGASSVYLALKVGQTVSASIPCAVLAAVLFRSRTRSTVLESNMVQTIGSAGESIAAGVVFTVPALIFLGFDIHVLHTFLLALTGGLLGVLMMIPLRRYLIVKEHGVLTYPEGTACAEILQASERGGAHGKRVLLGIVVGSLYKFLMAALRFWQDTPTWLPRWYSGGTLAAEVSPELLGVGYIIGYRTSALMVAGGVLSWLILIPIFRFLGQGLTAPLFPGTQLISQMSTEEIYYAYVRYIGAGAVATGGLINLFRSMPSIIASFKASAQQFLHSSSDVAATQRRTERDMPISLVVIGSAALVLLIWLLPTLQINFLSAILIVVFGFFFSVVASRLTGQVGSSSCPNSGMAIATLIGTCLIFLLIGWSGRTYSALALSVGAIVCIASSNAGTTSQDLKTGFLLGATPIRQQTGLLIGVMTSVLVIGWTLYYLNAAFTTKEPRNFPDYSAPATLLQGNPSVEGPDKQTYVRVAFVGDAHIPDGHYLVNPQDGKIRYQEVQGIESKWQAPQAKLMSVVIRGILDQRLPWGLILMGVFIAIMVELVGVQALPFGVGCYLSLSTTGAIFLGGLVRKAADLYYRREPDDPNEAEGTLYSSGLIAGGALVGILTAVIAGFNLNEKLALGPRLLGSLADSRALSLLMFVGLGWSLFRSAKR